MKKFIRPRGGASKGAALIIVLALVVIDTALPQTPTPPVCSYAVSGSMAINRGGHNYAVGDRLRAVGGIRCIEAFPLSLQVTSVDANGGVTAATIIDVDSKGYIIWPSNPISFGGSASGSDFQASFSFATR